MKFVYFVVLLAFNGEGIATEDSGVKADWTLSDCHARTQAFSKLHGTHVELCKKILKTNYDILASQEATFNWAPGELSVVVPDNNEEVKRLRRALKEIGKWHRGKTKDSQRVRRIIKKALR